MSYKNYRYLRERVAAHAHPVLTGEPYRVGPETKQHGEFFHLISSREFFILGGILRIETPTSLLASNLLGFCPRSFSYSGVAGQYDK